MAKRFLGVGTTHGVTWDDDPIYPNHQTAEETSVDASAFAFLLNSGDDTVQKCMDKLDKVPCFIDGGRVDEVYSAACNINGGGA